MTSTKSFNYATSQHLQGQLSDSELAVVQRLVSQIAEAARKSLARLAAAFGRKAS